MASSEGSRDEALEGAAPAADGPAADAAIDAAGDLEWPLLASREAGAADDDADELLLPSAACGRVVGAKRAVDG